MNTRSFIFFTRILSRAQISSLIFRELFYWGFIGHNFGDYKNWYRRVVLWCIVLSVTILETTKTKEEFLRLWNKFYRSQFWRLQKPIEQLHIGLGSFIGHNFGDYKNWWNVRVCGTRVLSVTILETTKTWVKGIIYRETFYRSQFWRLQKPEGFTQKYMPEFYRSQFWRLQKQALPPPWLYQRFIGHNFGDYKNSLSVSYKPESVLSVTILETTKTPPI